MSRKTVHVLLDLSNEMAMAREVYVCKKRAKVGLSDIEDRDPDGHYILQPAIFIEEPIRDPEEESE